MSTVYPSIKSPALAAAMLSVGPVSEWAWFDYLSPGDVLRVVRLRQIIAATDTPADVATAAATAYAEIGRVAQWRMAEAPQPSRAGGFSVADAAAGFERLRGNSANGTDAVQMFSAGFAGVSPGPSAPENDPKALRAAMNRAFEEIRGMRKEFGNPDSDYGAGAKEACDRIAAALVIAE